MISASGYRYVQSLDDLIGADGLGQIVLVGKNEQRNARQRRLRQQIVQLGMAE